MIGEGAFGSVYRAVQPSVGREVAVKVIRRRAGRRPPVRAALRGRGPARRPASSTPTSSRSTTSGGDPGGAFLVFRLLRGGSLGRPRGRRAARPGEVTRLVEEIGGALTAAHALGVVHRDVKPANVLFDEVGNSYLADFGIAVGWTAPTTSADLQSAGSPLYASPEQVRDRSASPASDQYALGVVVWEALCGGRPSRARRSPRSAGRSSSTRCRRSTAAMAGADALGPVLRRPPRPTPRTATAPSPSSSWRGTMAVAGAEPRPHDRLLGRRAARAGPWLRPLASLQMTGINPYKGLRSFQEADAGEFCGRDALVGRLVERVEPRPRS